MVLLQADADGNGTIDYDEFITATMHLNRMDREEHLYTAFQYFDKDNSGYLESLDLKRKEKEGFSALRRLIFRYITTEELEQALTEFGMHDGRDIREIISEVDGDNVRAMIFHVLSRAEFEVTGKCVVDYGRTGESITTSSWR